jgi:hypothetical protein
MGVTRVGLTDILLIAGVPAAGKSYYCQWLERTHGFKHFDVEKDDRVEQYGLQAPWLSSLSGTAKPLVDRLRTLKSPVVWNWGFPPEWIHVVDLMKSEGIQLWWFDADHAAARAEFIKRGGIPVERMDGQLSKIMEAEVRIRELFHPNIIMTLQADGTRLSPERIYARMQATRDGGSGL